MRSEISRILKINRPGRAVDVFPDDRYVVSHPRSGNTWLRFLIAELLMPGQVDFTTIESIIPDIYQNRHYKLSRVTRPRILKSHEYFDPRYPKVIYLVRDPRDVCLSYYHYHRKNRWLHNDLELDEFVGMFIKGELRGDYGNWNENVGSWVGARADSSDFITVRYEDLLADTINELKPIAKFLDINASLTDLSRAVERASVQRMMKLEEKQSSTWSTTQSTDTTIPFIRTATTGTWKKELSKTSQLLIEKVCEPWMTYFDYR